MAKRGKPYYTFEEYRALIHGAESKDELKTIGDQISEDSQNGHYDIMKFVDLKAQIAMKYSDFTIAELRQRMDEE